MTRTLDVYLHQQLVGHLIQDHQGQMTYSYFESWLNHAGAFPLSHSLPLQKERFNRNECRGFFGGVLPDESKREIIAKNLGISARNDFAMLGQIGGECAGAVTFMPAGVRLPQNKDRYRPLSRERLALILRQLPQRPLMAGDDGIRLSLAGAQDKIAVHVADGKISIPLGGAPSTHILKPAVIRFEGIVFNEAFCMKLAHAMGLYTARVEIGLVENIQYLLVQRYDRVQVPASPNRPESLDRLHQEDFCQALGISPDNKYQNEGGPSLQQSFQLVRELSSAPVIDLQRLLDAVIFNLIVGNHDAHGKNFSLLYGRETRLAPLYDLLSTVSYPELAKKMAMKIGGEYASDKVGPKHFDQLAEEAGLGKPTAKRRVLEIANRISEKIPEIIAELPETKGIGSLIQSRSAKIRQRFR